MIPPHSWPVPGRKPGTSTKVSTGMLNASQVRTNRAAFSDASMSRQPAKCIGWLATTPTGAPVDPAEADDDVRREAGVHLEELAVVQHVSMTVCMSYGWFGESGISVSSSSSWLGDLSPPRPGRRAPTAGGSSRLLDGR